MQVPLGLNFPDPNHQSSSFHNDNAEMEWNTKPRFTSSEGFIFFLLRGKKSRSDWQKLLFSLAHLSLLSACNQMTKRSRQRLLARNWSVVQFPGFEREYFSSCSLWSSLLVASVTKHYSPLLMMYLVCFLLRKRIGDKNLKSDCVKKRMEQILEVRLHFFERKKMIAGKDSILWNGDDDNDGEMIGFKLFSSHSFQFRFMFLPCSQFVSFW